MSATEIHPSRPETMDPHVAADYHKQIGDFLIRQTLITQMAEKATKQVALENKRQALHDLRRSGGELDIHRTTQSYGPSASSGDNVGGKPVMWSH